MSLEECRQAGVRRISLSEGLGPISEVRSKWSEVFAVEASIGGMPPDLAEEVTDLVLGLLCRARRCCEDVDVVSLADAYLGYCEDCAQHRNGILE